MEGGQASSFEECCAALGPEKCAQIDAYWTAFFDAKWPDSPKTPSDGDESEWFPVNRHGSVSWEGESHSAHGLQSPTASRQKKVGQRPAQSETQDGLEHTADSASLFGASGEGVQHASASVSDRTSLEKPTATRSCRERQATAHSSNQSVRKSGVRKAASERFGPVTAASAAPRRYRRAASCTPLGTPALPLTTENLALGMQNLIHSETQLIPTASDRWTTSQPPSGFKRKKEAEKDEYEGPKKRYRNEESLTCSSSSKRKRDGDERADTSRKRSRSDSYSVNSSDTSEDTHQMFPMDRSHYITPPRLMSWLVEPAAVRYETMDPPSRDSNPNNCNKSRRIEQAVSKNPLQHRSTEIYNMKSTKETQPTPTKALKPTASDSASPIRTMQQATSKPPDFQDIWKQSIVAQYADVRWHIAARLASRKRTPPKPPVHQRRKFPVVFLLDSIADRIGSGGFGSPTAVKSAYAVKEEKVQHSRDSSPTIMLVNTFQAINAHCSAVGTTSVVIDTAKIYFQELISTRQYEHRSTQALATACIVRACRWNNFPHTKEHIFSFTNVPAGELEGALREVDRFFISRREQYEEQEREAAKANHPSAKVDTDRTTNSSATWWQDQIRKHKDSAVESFKDGSLIRPSKHFSRILAT